MPQLNIVGSPNISVLDSKITVDICLGKFFVDLTTSIFIGTGYNNVLGAKVKIVNEAGVPIKIYGASTYDIAPPMSAVYELALPLLGSGYDIGTYSISVEITDANGKKYEVTKPVQVAPPSSINSQKLFGEVYAKIEANCGTGHVHVIVDNPKNYLGKAATSKAQSYVLSYPNTSGVSPLTSTTGSFSVGLYDGRYRIIGTMCATYSMGDNVFSKVLYKLDCKQDVMCNIDLCCVFERMAEINTELDKEGCNENEKVRLSNVIADALLLLKLIELSVKCNNDPSGYIQNLESLLGCSCICQSSAGVPIVPSSPTGSYVLNGCGVSVVTIGLTTTYTINNYTHVLYIDPALQWVTAGTPSISGCTKSLPISFDISKLYTAIKAQVNSKEEFEFWGNIIKKPLNNIPAALLTCLGVTNQQFNDYNWRDTFLLVLTKICNCCSSSSGCKAKIGVVTTANFGSNTRISWVGSDAAFVRVYIDGVYFTEVVFPTERVNIPNTADGIIHTYKLVAVCSNGTYGEVWSATYMNVITSVCPTPTGVGFGTGVLCSAPLSVQVVRVGSTNSIRFNSAAIPPPSNSYMVYRSPAGLGSFTVIGAATYNSTLSKFEAIDSGASNNILYDYKAESQCQDGSRPSTIIEFANITCPVMATTQTVADNLVVEFPNVGGNVNAYDVSLFDATGMTQIGATQNITTPFTSPIRVIFSGVRASAVYVLRVRVFINAYSKECPAASVTTPAASYPYVCPSEVIGGADISPNSSTLSRLSAKDIRVLMNVDIPAGTYTNQPIMRAVPLNASCIPPCNLIATSLDAPGLTFTLNSDGRLYVTGTLSIPFTGNLILNFDETDCSN